MPPRRGDGASIGLFSGPDLIELTESRAGRTDDRKREEATAMRAKLAPGLLIAFDDERGASLGSEAFAARLGQSRDAGAKSAGFLIGGATGSMRACGARPRWCCPSAALTLPHQLVRALVLEQLYRALTILAGHPYHRA